ncbi:SPOR domain-containing protein [Halarsenatibacter silvermanii]|uniref:Sporulation related domain-containing protein n=1 Tax=Halarsenatibacter silvermanii TaxID=321763 RepID=A0A1G9P9S7_9FIRM|nr:SPOR domain-containing protein [Halarsenatibacter silvermanii]SDL95454.1 Sporulation related domain-containing protein [Halarsenatibacter silvermanii]
MRFLPGQEEGALKFVALLLIVSLAAVYAGFRIGNTFFARRMGGEETVEVEEGTVPPEEDFEEDVMEQTEDEDLIDLEEAPETEEDIQEGIEEDDAPEDIEIDREANFLVQVGAFGYEESAEEKAEELRENGYPAFVSSREPYRVQVVGGDTREEAEELADQLIEEGYEAFVHGQ